MLQAAAPHRHMRSGIDAHPFCGPEGDADAAAAVIPPALRDLSVLGAAPAAPLAMAAAVAAKAPSTLVGLHIFDWLIRPYPSMHFSYVSLVGLHIRE
eukprot:jgi/Ulvmu1/3430/UM016_0049.1